MKGGDPEPIEPLPWGEIITVIVLIVSVAVGSTVLIGMTR